MDIEKHNRLLDVAIAGISRAIQIIEEQNEKQMNILTELANVIKNLAPKEEVQ